MTLPLMPKATAVWLIENTALTFEQIADFCGMHPLEIQSIADGDVGAGMLGVDPIAANQLTAEEIKRCEADPDARLKLADVARQYVQTKAKGGRYTPVARRNDKPDAIAWLIKQFPTLPDSKIIKLIGTTRSTIEAVRSKSHWNTANIKPKDPVLAGLCSQTQLDNIVAPYRQAAPEPAAEDEGDAA